MFSSSRVRRAAAALVAAIAAGGMVAALTTAASASPRHPGAGASAREHGPKLSLHRFDLNGYVINADYTLGRNIGNTFQQTYADATVQGVPIAGPSVGMKFPAEDYVAVPIGHHELYITWLDPQTHAIVDVFVMNFATRTVYDYAPGSTHPESAGRIAVVRRGSRPLP